ncbi:class III extradiol ring-cleavage dioxygenase family protein [Micromonospora oryzae]|uniref:hypothetical protein n=1 Tax=Micromonospora sp. DSM 102119 TaxID=3111768 RepID=UPI0031DF58AF
MTGSARGRTGGSRYGERVPLVAAAVCPHPPLIVPELAGAAAAELDELRRATDAAVARLLACGARRLVVVGTGDRTADLDYPYRGCFAPWGLPLEVRLGSSPGGAFGTDGLPLSLLVGAWLLNRARPRPGPIGWRMVSLAPDEPVESCAAGGARISTDQPWALLVMGDGSACHGTKAPGYADPLAGAYDDGVARALADADAEALLGLDPAVSARLKVAGRAPWQVLAGAALAAGGDWRGDLTYHDAPYGVGYFVATWERA